MKSNANVIGIIPAREGSKRLKNKNILPLLGKPLMAYTIEAALRAEKLDRVFVSTDSDRIAETAVTYGAELVRRSPELATSTASIDAALRHVVTYLENTEGYMAEIAVLMQANVPIRGEGVINKVVTRLSETGAETVATAYEINQRPEWMKRIIDGKAVPYMSPSDLDRMQDLEKLYLLDGAVVAIRVDTLMRTKGNSRVHAYMGEDIRLVLQDILYSVEIDTPDDLWLAECLLRGMHWQDGDDDASQS